MNRAPRAPAIRALTQWLLLLLATSTASAADDSPFLLVLGVAQDAGYPQAGCYRPHCMPGWRDPALRRGATALALVDPGAGRHYLFEATPNLPDQLYRLEREAPSTDFELGGIFLTHAHIGHYAGLMFLGHEAMGADGVPVFAMPRMREFLATNGPWSQLVGFGNIALQPLENGTVRQFGTLRVTPFLVPHRDEYSETVGYRIDSARRSAVFIPDIDKWSKWNVRLATLIEDVDYALIDATFFAGDELPGRDMADVPHPSVTDTMRLLRGLSAEERGKVWFIHMNHTNPLLDPDSPASIEVRDSGYNVAVEGLRLGM